MARIQALLNVCFWDKWCNLTDLLNRPIVPAVLLQALIAQLSFPIAVNTKTHVLVPFVYIRNVG